MSPPPGSRPQASEFGPSVDWQDFFRRTERKPNCFAAAQLADGSTSQTGALRANVGSCCPATSSQTANLNMSELDPGRTSRRCLSHVDFSSNVLNGPCLPRNPIGSDRCGTACDEDMRRAHRCSVSRSVSVNTNPATDLPVLAAAPDHNESPYVWPRTPGPGPVTLAALTPDVIGHTLIVFVVLRPVRFYRCRVRDNAAGVGDKPGLLLRKLIELDRKLSSLYGRASKVGDREFFDATAFPWVGAVEADWRKVRAELDTLLPYAADLPNFQDISRDQEFLTQDDGWKTFFFYAYGLKMVANCRRCPETTKLLQGIPGMKTAFFSILAPHKHLPPHCGPYKGVLRLHLGLLVPKPSEMCGIRVGAQTRHWQEGRVMIFDDRFEHEAWNRTDGPRAVLFVDFVRPMRFPANMLNAVLVWCIAFSPFVLGGVRNYLRWEKRFDAVVDRGAARSRRLAPEFLRSIFGIGLGK
jgi:hypothetical protein